MKTVYVAGAMSANNILDVLGNISRGIKLGGELLQLGYAPFVPHLDVFFKIQGGDDLQIPLDHYYNYTMEFMTRCDCVLVCPKSENSSGTVAEIKKASGLGIPVYYSIDELHKIESEIKEI